MGERSSALEELELLRRDRAPQVVHDRDRVAVHVGGLEVLLPEPETRSAREPSSSVTTFTSESLNIERSLRLAEPIVSQRSSTTPIFECT